MFLDPLPILSMRMRPAELTKWHSFTVSAQVLLICFVTPPAFILCFTIHLHKHHPPFTTLHSTLAWRDPHLHAKRHPSTHNSPQPPSSTHTVLFLSSYWTVTHTTWQVTPYTWCYRVRPRDLFSWVMRDCRCIVYLHCWVNVGKTTVRVMVPLLIFEAR